MVNFPSINSTRYAKLQSQNGESIVTIDSVTPFHPMYKTTYTSFRVVRGSILCDLIQSNPSSD